MSVKGPTDTVREQVLDFVNVKFNLPEDVAGTISLEELGIDSLGVIQIEMMIRKEFGINFEDGVLSGESTLDNVITETEMRLAGASNG